MAEPIFVAVQDVQKDNRVVFDIATATLVFGDKYVTVNTQQGVKFKANPQEILALLDASEIVVMQVQAKPQEEAVEAPVEQEAEVEA